MINREPSDVLECILRILESDGMDQETYGIMSARLTNDQAFGTAQSLSRIDEPENTRKNMQYA